MRYLSVAELAEKWGVAERTIRNYCAEGRIPGAFRTGRLWCIPEDAVRPSRANQKADAPRTLLEVLCAEKNGGVRGGIYQKVQIELTYNSNHMEGSRLTHDQTRLIYETNTIGVEGGAVNVDDIVETANHFRCINLVLEQANQPLSEAFLKELHRTLKNGTSDSRKAWFAVGEYKRLPNEVGGQETGEPEETGERIRTLLRAYRSGGRKTLEELLAFHVAFERIHPFQDGNGRVGRLILFKECLRNGIVPFVISEDLKLYYYRGLHEWENERGYLLDTCLTAQDRFKAWLDYFRIPY